ncbi:MAG: DUF973 family protein [Candidatus Methanodesulfokora sp.]
MSKGRLDDLIEGIERLKNGALVSILSIFLGIAAFIVLLAFLPQKILNMSLYLNITEVNRTVVSFIGKRLVAALPYLAASGIMLIIAAVLAIASFILFFMATGSLKRYNEDLGLGRMGLIIVLISLFLPLLILVGGILIAPTAPMGEGRHFPRFPVLMPVMLIMILLIILSSLLMIIGLILFSIMLIRLPKEGDVDEGFKTAGIIMAAGSVLMLIPLISIIGLVLFMVALILIYTSAKSSLKKLRSGVVVL